MLGYIISDKDEINVEENEIKSFDILRGTDLNIFVIENNKVLYKNDIINNASAYGHVQVLEWFKKSGYKFKYDEWAINEASSNGNIQVLEWFKNSYYEFKYDKWAITYASQNGHIQVLEWFKNSGYKFKYNKYALDTTCFKILKFFSYKINIKKLLNGQIKLFLLKHLNLKLLKNILKGIKKIEIFILYNFYKNVRLYYI
jgi:hypothetical protein